MTIKPRTIDNLGIEASIRYAKDQELIEANLIKDATFVSQKTEISVAKPYVLSEFDQLFSPKRTVIWASFSPPPNYFAYSKSLFSYQIIPSLGAYEKQEKDEDILAAIEDMIQKHKKSKQDHSDTEDEEEEKERQMISNLLSCIAKLDKSLILINSRRNQYQRG